MSRSPAQLVSPGEYDPANSSYPVIRTSRVHRIVEDLFALDHAGLIANYCARHPVSSRSALLRLLEWRCSNLVWAGCDFFPLRLKEGEPGVLLLETNSCPAGQKSMPAVGNEIGPGGYRRIYDELFAGIPADGPLAVLFDKNEQEARGYAATFATESGRDAVLVPVLQSGYASTIRFVNGVLEIGTASGWMRAAGALRYVTDQPWLRLPLSTSTPILNPVIACLAGGRNKHLANLAYERFNERWKGRGFSINAPSTVGDLARDDVAAAVAAFGGQAVIKTPYGHAGDGIFPVVREEGLAQWRLANESGSGRYVVQRLIGEEHRCNAGAGDADQVVFDFRMMLSNGSRGFRLISTFGRKAKQRFSFPLRQESVRDQLITNISFRDQSGQWQTDPQRVVPFNEENFGRLGLTLDDLIDAFLQSAMAMVAIDELSKELSDSEGKLDLPAFHSLNGDRELEQAIAKHTHRPVWR